MKLLTVVSLLGGSGCYYAHLAEGQARLLMARRSVSDVLTDPETTTELRQSLSLVQRARSYAAEIGLEVEGQYTSYVQWPGDRIVTSLIVTEPGQIDARPFDFPIIGRVPYKGFFDQERAEREAAELRDEGLDVCLVPVSAYSTLGWFDDPLTDPMLRGDEGRLAETILHELVHATVFLKSQPDFNESVASFIGQEASIGFFADEPLRAERRRAEVEDGRTLARETMAFREDLRLLYEQGLDEPKRTRARAEIEAAARKRIGALALSTRDAARTAERLRLNDACVALRGTYTADIPRHALQLDRLDGDLPRFIDRLRSVADADDPRARFFEAPVPDSPNS
jgi:predicted aminopeptidase